MGMMSEQKREIVQITTSVEITYSTPEGRAAVIECAKKAIHLDWYSTAHGGIGAKRAAQKGAK